MANHLPRNITHPLHPQHQLELELDYDWHFVCDKCSYISTGSRYNCFSCDFKLDLACASSVTDEEWLSFRKEKKKGIQHFIHIHKLTLFRYRKIKKEDYNCSWCEKRLFHSDVCYGCFDIRCKLFFHEVCLGKMTRTLFHPFHYSSHLLRFLYNPEAYCSACLENIDRRTPFCVMFRCEVCNFCIDFRCAKLLPTLKHKCHPHLLTCFRETKRPSPFSCGVCHMSINCHINFYCCVQCNFNVHLQCISTPTVNHKYHEHLLVLMDSVKEDDSIEYYCDVCEKERNPQHPVYYCKKCTYVAHMECIVGEYMGSSEEVPLLAAPSISMDTKANNQGTGDFHPPQKVLNRQPIHKHPLKFYEVTENLNESQYCRGCRQVLSGPTYICTECGYNLHERCANLAYDEIQHPSHTHPLYFYAEPQYNYYKVCDQCRDICFGFIYCCEECNFKVDVKCAINAGAGVSQRKEEERVTELLHFTHPHNLIVAYGNDPISTIFCKVCQMPILGPSYFCPDFGCFYVIHESCLGIPQKMQVPFHMEHMFVFRSNEESGRCSACNLEIECYELAYSCEEQYCLVRLHYICANSLMRSLKYESHMHDHLYYFGAKCQLLFVREKRQLSFPCLECKDSCEGRPFYRCLDCRFNFHLECLHIPHVLKSKCHIHLLTLKDSFIEDDLGKYYCDTCEEERSGSDHVYYCEDCNGLFVAHIECVLTEVEEVLRYLDPHQRKKLPRCEEDYDDL